MQQDTHKTTQAYWENVHAGQPRMRLPSYLVVSTRNLQRLLKKYIKPGMSVLEIGFAPGKQLANVAKVLEANVSGLDYSESGVDFSRQLFASLGITGDLRCEDVFATTFPMNSFDFVYSVGVIEHFDDPTGIVRRHIELLKPGGTALILVPNYRGIYGRLQNYLDRENLLIHNLDIMTRDAMKKLAPRDLVAEAETFRVGRIDPTQISLRKRLPGPVAKLSQLFLNGIGLLQPFDIGILCPWIALRAVRSGR